MYETKKQKTQSIGLLSNMEAVGQSWIQILFYAAYFSFRDSSWRVSSDFFLQKSIRHF